MAWDDDQPEDDYEEYEEEEEDLDWGNDPDDPNPPAIVRNVYGSNHPDPFDLRELDHVLLTDYIQRTSTSATASGIKYFINNEGNLEEVKPEKIPKSKTLLFDEQNLVIDSEVKSDRKQKVRGVRRGHSPKTPNK